MKPEYKNANELYENFIKDKKRNWKKYVNNISFILGEKLLPFADINNYFKARKTISFINYKDKKINLDYLDDLLADLSFKEWKKGNFDKELDKIIYPLKKINEYIFYGKEKNKPYSKEILYITTRISINKLIPKIKKINPDKESLKKIIEKIIHKYESSKIDDEWDKLVDEYHQINHIFNLPILYYSGIKKIKEKGRTIKTNQYLENVINYFRGFLETLNKQPKRQENNTYL